MRQHTSSIASFFTPRNGVTAARLLYEERNNPALARIYESYAWFVPLSLFRSPLSSLPALAFRERRYQYEDQRPDLYFPFLRAEPWWPDDEITALLERSHPQILADFNGVETQARKHAQKYLVSGGDWSVFNLFRDNRKIEENCAACPFTTQLIESLPTCPDGGGLAYYSIMAPGTHVNPHCAFTNSRLRYHLGLDTDGGARIRVGKESRNWQTGVAFVFDDSFDHAVFHEGERRRVIFLVDCWHPELTLEERHMIRNLMAALGLPDR